MARRLVTTQQDPHDRRRRAIALSDSGRRTAEAAVGIAASITAATLASLTRAEQLTVVRLLKKLG